MEFATGWFNMHLLDILFDVDFINLEAKNDPRITNWKPIGNDDYGPYERGEIDLRPIYKLPFVKRHFDNEM